MPKMLNYRTLREEYDADPRGTCRGLDEEIAKGAVRPADLSIRDLAEAFLGEAVVRSMEPTRKSGGLRLLEAASAVDTSAFSNITGQIVFSTVKEQFRLATMIADALSSTKQTSFLQGEKIPGVGGIGDEAEVVDEGQPYPTVGVNEEYVETPALKKRGFIVPVTREIIVADRTNLLMDECGKGGKWLGLNKEKRVLDVALGVTNTYRRNGTSTNTYLTAGTYVNVVSTNALVDWTDVENALLAFDALTDPNTGEPIGADIMSGKLQVVVPSALAMTAARVLHATDIRFGDGASNTTATYAPNPLVNAPITGGRGFELVTSPYVKNRTGSATNWFVGDFKSAVAYMEAWGIETSQAPSNSQADFTHDIRMQFKVSEMGAAAMLEPRRLVKNTP